MSRTSRRHLLRLLLASPFLARAASADPSKPFSDTKQFTLLHSNDPHGHLLPFSYPDKVAPGSYIAQMPAHRNIGGLAHRAAAIQKIKKREKNVKVFDCGDAMDGTPFSVEYLGKADYDAMSLAGFDYGTLGNHDFNMTAAQFKEMVGHIKYPIYLANVYNQSDDKPAFTPFVIENWDGVRVAIFGLTTYSTRTYKALAEAYKIREPMSVARELVPALRKQADLLVLISHNGYDEDVKMAQEIPGIDVIVGAHSHTRLPVGAYQVANRPGKADPTGTVIVQAHCWGGELGRVDLEVSKNTERDRWQITRYSARLLPITSDMPADKAVAATVARYWEPIQVKYSEVLGTATEEFVELEGDDPTNYYLMTDAIHAGLKAAGSDADFELENFGGVRAAVLKGPITRSALLEVDPFTNTIFTFKIKGGDLKKLLQYTRPAPSRSLRYVATRVAPTTPEARPTWTLTEATLNGKPIDDDTVYRGAASSYYFTGQVKRYAIDAKDTGIMRLVYLADYIKKNTPISPTPDGRIKLVGGSAYDGA